MVYYSFLPLFLPSDVISPTDTVRSYWIFPPFDTCCTITMKPICYLYPCIILVKLVLYNMLFCEHLKYIIVSNINV